MKKLLALLLCAVLCLSLAACASNTATTTTTTEPAASTETAAETPAAEETAEAPAEEAPDAKQYVVGICQLVQHDALDAATNGFMDALNEALPGQVTFDLKNASNDIPTCGTIVTGFVASNVDLILANATPALQAASTATQTIPILGTAVTEYGVALDIKDFNGTVGGNISGTSDLAPLDQQADMLLELLPEAQNVGILYCSTERRHPLLLGRSELRLSGGRREGCSGRKGRHCYGLHVCRLQRCCDCHADRLRRK